MLVPGTRPVTSALSGGSPHQSPDMSRIPPTYYSHSLPTAIHHTSHLQHPHTFSDLTMSGLENALFNLKACLHDAAHDDALTTGSSQQSR